MHLEASIRITSKLGKMKFIPDTDQGNLVEDLLKSCRERARRPRAYGLYSRVCL
jgi:hypothetical protein